MKTKIIWLALLLVSAAVSQNPDGKNVSLHITPSWLWGSSQYSATTNVFYPEQYQMPSQIISSVNKGTIENPLAFGIHALVKLPIFSFLTVSAAYSYNQQFEQFSKYNVQSPYFSNYFHVNGSLQSFSATISVYNLFSVYQN
ncbi:MAG: hypothetical protein H3C35_04245 [Bacteroidetes bacterium]|nr:hypothetical protein [Bacteroidota bacterium]